MRTADASFAPVIHSTTSTGATQDGLDLFRRHWQPNGPARAALLLVHEIGEHSGRYEHVGAAFAEAGIDVVAPDQRGFGRSGGRRAHVKHFDEFLADIEMLIGERRTLGVPVILMGHSLGGLISIAYLLGHRPQPDLAVLSSPALAAQLPAWQRIAAPVLGTVLPRLKIPADFDGGVLSRDEAVQVAYENDPLRVPFSTARLGREVLRIMKSVAITLDRLHVPTYVLHGSDDTLVPVTASAPLGTLAHVERRVWGGLRHECLNEPEHDEVIAAIVAWIDHNLADLGAEHGGDED